MKGKCVKLLSGTGVDSMSKLVSLRSTGGKLNVRGSCRACIAHPGGVGKRRIVSSFL